MHWQNRLMRRPDINEPGHAHELTFSCYHRFQFLTVERTCAWLADAINKARVRRDFWLWAYVFMPEHAHLLIVPRKPQYDIDKIFGSIKQPVAQRALSYVRVNSPRWLPRLRVQYGQRVKHYFWQPGGGFDRNAVDPKIILAMIDYMHANPVRRQLVERPEDFRWSSAGWFEGKNSLRPDPIDFGGEVVFRGGRE